MDSNIGKLISKLRKERGWTQKELGEKLFITDKAISKWERGVSIPDFTLLHRIAEVFDIKVSDLVSGEINSSNEVNVEEKVKELQKIHKQKRKKFFVGLGVLLIIVFCLLFRNVYLGYRIRKIHYPLTDRMIEVGIPKTSFWMKSNERSYSFKNLRNANIVRQEVRNYLKTLDYSTCNQTIYYYQAKSDYSIINYDVKNHFLYNTVSYEIVEGDYCELLKMEEYSKKLGVAMGFHCLNGCIIDLNEEKDEIFEVEFMDTTSLVNHQFIYTGELEVTIKKRVGDRDYVPVIIEKSSGRFDIQGDVLYYYRDNIEEKDSSINIPSVSSFQLEDGNMRLIDNYLKEYYEGDIILKIPY